MLLGQGQGVDITDDPVKFKTLVRERPRIEVLWKRRSVATLVITFLLLRASRQNWHQNPCPPHNIDKHGRLARAIDDFLVVDTLNWGGSFCISWLLQRGLDLLMPDDQQIAKGRRGPRNTSWQQQ